MRACAWSIVKTMPDVAERSTDIGIAQSTVPAAAAAQMSAAFLNNGDMISSVFNLGRQAKYHIPTFNGIVPRGNISGCNRATRVYPCSGVPLVPRHPNTPELP